MNVYRIRKKSTGLYWRGAGANGHGKWTSKGKLYTRAQDAKAALSAYIRGIEFGTQHEYRLELGFNWRDTYGDLQKAELIKRQAARVEAALEDIEVLKYDFTHGETLNVEEFRGKTTR